MTPCQKEAMNLASFFRNSLEDWHIACDFVDEKTVMTALNSALRNACYTCARVIKLASQGSESAAVIIDSIDRSNVNKSFKFISLNRKTDRKFAYLIASLIGSEIEQSMKDYLEEYQQKALFQILAFAIQRFLHHYHRQAKGDAISILFFTGFDRSVPHYWELPSLSKNAPEFLAEPT